MRRIINFLIQLAAGILVILLLMAVWIVIDGLNDVGAQADVGLLMAPSNFPKTVDQPWLDHVADLYKHQEFPFLILSATRLDNGEADATPLETYLVAHGIPSTAILRCRRGETEQEAAQNVAEIMKAHQFESVLLITDYYRVTRTKAALGHEGVDTILKAHLGSLKLQDAWSIGHEVISLGEYLGTYYFLPEAKKVGEEARVGADKAGAEADKARKTVDKKLDNLSK
jgi:hypothetical protein